MNLSNNIEEPERSIKEWLAQLKTFRLSAPINILETTGEDVKGHINEAAYYISLEKLSYDDLCWRLAENILKKTLSEPSIEDVRKKAEEIFLLSKTYDELCWLNAEFDILTKNK
jgi:hypothetical protein